MNEIKQIVKLIFIRDQFISNKKFSILCGAEGIRGWFHSTQPASFTVLHFTAKKWPSEQVTDRPINGRLLCVSLYCRLWIQYISFMLQYNSWGCLGCLFWCLIYDICIPSLKKWSFKKKGEVQKGRITNRLLKMLFWGKDYFQSDRNRNSAMIWAAESWTRRQSDSIGCGHQSLSWQA